MIFFLDHRNLTRRLCVAGAGLALAAFLAGCGGGGGGDNGNSGNNNNSSSGSSSGNNGGPPSAPTQILHPFDHK